jgi:hypothetical protein
MLTYLCVGNGRAYSGVNNSDAPKIYWIAHSFSGVPSELRDCHSRAYKYPFGAVGVFSEGVSSSSKQESGWRTKVSRCQSRKNPLTASLDSVDVDARVSIYQKGLLDMALHVLRGIGCGMQARPKPTSTRYKCSSFVWSAESSKVTNIVI